MPIELSNQVRHNSLPPVTPDGIYNVPARLNKYAEAIVQAYGPNQGVEEGSRFISANPTLGTAIATTTSITAFTAASPVMLAQNKNGIGGANITLDYLRLLLSQVPTSATNWNWAGIVDTSSRYTSGGTTIVPANLNTGGAGSGLLLVFGAIVAAAASQAARTVHRSIGRSAIPVTLDEWLFKYGSQNHEGAGSLGGAVALRMPIPGGPVVLRPGDTYLLYGWGTANAAAPSWEFELGHTER
jgi:hypothetical protein